MTEPTTRTGQRLWPQTPVPEYMRDIARETRANILAIEAEAGAQVREQLLERVRQERRRVTDGGGGDRESVRWGMLIRLLADPDRDRATNIGGNRVLPAPPSRPAVIPPQAARGGSS
jgi:hypothetical protein